ncbi:VOC family protein [Frankia sp. Cr2]|uniref:VOC family protein n=1 Tax=Frankia sp. Cr2 TaxID=3073932 RepID=UPI002AD276A9|nr:VOC family protein [Frankia sp. Cr2]
MRNTADVFHLAIPVMDLAAAERFYVDLLGCRLARRYPDRITLDFFGDQLVCHLTPDYEPGEATLYPRHFGVTFRDGADFNALLRLVELREVAVFQPEQVRFAGLVEHHRTVVLRDPSGNLLEFKHYVDPRMMY